MNIVSLTQDHYRRSFDCGEQTINAFLQQGALQDQKLGLSRTSVLIDESDDPNRILGFHTLVLTVVDQELIPNDRPRIKRKIPVILLGQLGVDINFQNRNYGNWLLYDAERRVAEIAKIVGVRCLMLDARNERLSQWYAKHDFVRFPESLRMFKSLKAIAKLVEG